MESTLHPQASQQEREVVLPAEDVDLLVGTKDANLHKIEKAFGVRLSARGGTVRVRGPEAATDSVAHLLEELSSLVSRGHRPGASDIDTAIRVIDETPRASLVEFFSAEGVPSKTGRLVTPRSVNQKLYLKAMSEDDLVLSIGPAGTGKTYLAVAVAASALLEHRVQRIVLARPAVEAGEKLGFLPGDLEEKINPYLRPLYDALYDILGFGRVGRMLEKGVIEVAPLAFMRGRTLNDSFIILDEAQNTTPEQMKMFLTRVGLGSKAVVTGDVTQIDLPPGRVSGLVQVQGIVRNIEGIGIVRFNEKDVVRHPLVQKIVVAYDRFDRQQTAEIEEERA